MWVLARDAAAWEPAKERVEVFRNVLRVCIRRCVVDSAVHKSLTDVPKDGLDVGHGCPDEWGGTQE